MKVATLEDCAYCAVLKRPCACKRSTQIYTVSPPAIPAAPLRVTANANPNLSVRVDGEQVPVPAPSPCVARTDLVCEDSDGTIRLVVGYGDHRPALPADCAALAYVRTRPGMVSINNRDLEIVEPALRTDNRTPASQEEAAPCHGKRAAPSQEQPLPVDTAQPMHVHGPSPWPRSEMATCAATAVSPCSEPRSCTSTTPQTAPPTVVWPTHGAT